MRQLRRRRGWKRKSTSSSGCGHTTGNISRDSDWQQWFDSGTADEKADRDSIDAGFDLFSDGRDVTVDEVVRVVERHPEWHSDARKKKP